MFDNLGVSLPLVKAGSLKLLAVASSQRLPALPEVPTLAETLPGFEAVAWYAIAAPPGTPQAITEKINADLNEALRQPEIRERLKNLSAETFGGSREKAAAYMKEEIERWDNVIKAAGVKLE
jgi:tripartite-type tricarboxylate transporter receptor subunit TctC